MSFAPRPETVVLARVGHRLQPGDADPAHHGLTAWVDQQLRPDPAPEPALAAKLAATRLPIKYPATADYPAVDEVRPLRTLDQPIEQLWPLSDGKKAAGAERNRIRTELVAATILRAVYSRWSLRELLVDFWHNHFNVSAYVDGRIAVALPAYDRDVIRRHWAGNFREFLEAVASSAAMLAMLNNRSSRAGAANENYARELFELHGLGRGAYLNALYNRWREVPGALDGQPEGYIDQDVYEAARAFTGWTVEDGQDIGGGRRLPQTGRFAYVEGWHDGYQKRVLATEFDPFQAAMADGRKVLDLVAAHPATARYVSAKLARRLAGEAASPALCAEAAAAWTQHRSAPDQIAQVVRAILLSPEFPRTPGVRVKRPLELLAGFVRATSIDLTVNERLMQQLAACGQMHFIWPSPTGHPDHSAYWLGTNAMRQRWALLAGLADGSWGTGAFQPSALEAPDRPVSVLGVAWLSRLLPGLIAPDEQDRLGHAIAQGMALDPHALLTAEPDAEARHRRLVAYAAMSEPFQIR